MNKTKQILCVFIFLFGFCSITHSSSMVEKHIFSPESAKDKPKDTGSSSPEIKDLYKSLSFTGIVITDTKKFVLLKEKTRRKDESEKKFYLKEGDEIKGMKIKQIKSNHIILTSKGEDVIFRLFSDPSKNRPAPEPEPKSAAVPQKSNTSKSPANSNVKNNSNNKNTKIPFKHSNIQRKTSINKRNTPAASSQAPQIPPSFAEMLKKAKERKHSGGSSSSTIKNPFLEAIRKAQNKGQ